METLTLDNINAVSGGITHQVEINAHLLQRDSFVVADLLAKYILEQLDASTFAAALIAHPANFDSIRIESVLIKVT